MELTLDRISKQFQNHIAVDGFSYTMSNGVYGLLGANGAGKTTLMRMICTVLNPTSGEILFNGTSISDIGAKYCDILGYLPQNFGYYPDFSAHEFLLYMASLKGMQGRAAKHRVEELLQMVGLSDVSRQKIRSLETLYIYALFKCFYFRWRVCHCYADEEKVCGCLPLDRRR